MKIEPVTLHSPSGRTCLEPLAEHHAAAIFEATNDAETWRLRPDPRPVDAGQMGAKIAGVLREAAVGARLPFAVRVCESNLVVGTTGYLDIQTGNRSLEIGATILGPRWQRTFVNTECKLTLLTHCFEVLGCVRVAFKVDTRNLRSQRAVERIGALREGALRKSKINHDGFIRDTAVFSIIDADWPAAKARIAALVRP